MALSMLGQTIPVLAVQRHGSSGKRFSGHAFAPAILPGCVRKAEQGHKLQVEMIRSIMAAELLALRLYRVAIGWHFLAGMSLVRTPQPDQPGADG